ncbi:MAG: ATP-binding protein, partial [Candidatus Omnitrophica bacterium]|nr:ATP-binding protein [Candidatus Omnitrophota bacterium]
VIDGGRGFPSYAIPRAYGRFTQFHKKEKDNLEGSGLGLAFCKLAVEELGGRIEIKSLENKGTKVTFILPNKNCS